MSKQEELDKKLRAILGDHSVTPPPQSWPQIETSLANVQKPVSWGVFMFFAASVAIIAGLGYLYFRKPAKKQLAAVTEKTIVTRQQAETAKGSAHSFSGSRQNITSGKVNGSNTVTGPNASAPASHTNTAGHISNRAIAEHKLHTAGNTAARGRKTPYHNDNVTLASNDHKNSAKNTATGSHETSSQTNNGGATDTYTQKADQLQPINLALNPEDIKTNADNNSGTLPSVKYLKNGGKKGNNRAITAFRGEIGLVYDPYTIFRSSTVTDLSGRVGLEVLDNDPYSKTYGSYIIESAPCKYSFISGTQSSYGISAGITLPANLTLRSGFYVQNLSMIYGKGVLTGPISFANPAPINNELQKVQFGVNYTFVQIPLQLQYTAGTPGRIHPYGRAGMVIDMLQSTYINTTPVDEDRGYNTLSYQLGAGLSYTISSKFSLEAGMNYNKMFQGLSVFNPVKLDNFSVPVGLYYHF